MTAISISADKQAEIDGHAARLDNQLAPLSGEAIVGLADICGVIKTVLPVLKTVQAIVCALSFIPALGKACAALKTVIAALEAACP